MTAYHLGFSPRKARFLAQFIRQPALALPEGEATKAGDQVYLWGATPVPEQVPAFRCVRVEDGFLRSAGLGAALAEPLSWVFDESGLHHDASQPTELERALATREVSLPQRERAARLRERIVAAGLTKYNVDRRPWAPSAAHAAHRSAGGKAQLVIGQVADDAAVASIRTPVRCNLALLAAVRIAHPGDRILYKPHPDVVAGLRRGGDLSACQLADEVIESAPLDALLAQVDAVHVMTSLTGFEALLRGAKVVCHGQPFYAGWGLTTDLAPIPRRTRTLSVDELVATALITYPRYRRPGRGEPCGAEDIVDWLEERLLRPSSIAQRIGDTCRWIAGRITAGLRDYDTAERSRQA